MATDPTPAQRVIRHRKIAAGAALTALLVATAGGTTAMMRAPRTVQGCQSTPTVTVQVTDDMYRTVFDQAQRLQTAGYVCARYQVTKVPAVNVDTAIRMGGNGIPDVWIPDSSIWVQDIASKLGTGWVNSGGTIATSPIVVGVPQSLAGQPQLTSTASWATALSTQAPLTVPDLNDSSAPMVAFAAADQVATGHDQQTTLLRAIVRLSRTTLSSDTLNLKATQSKATARAFPVSEHDLIAFDKANPGKKVGVLVPGQGVPSLDYPFVTPVKATQAPTAAVKALYAALTSTAARNALSQDGFRVPASNGSADSTPPPGSPLPRNPTSIAAPQPAQAVTTVKAWTNLAKDARMLCVIDVSGSMSTEVSPGTTRIDVLQGVAIGALNALPPTTQMGAGIFSTNLQGKGKDYLDMSGGVHTIGGNPQALAYKNGLVAKAKTLPTYVERNGDTALYDSIGAAYDYMTKTFDPGYVNSVVVLTDGQNDDPNGGLNLTQLMAKLRSAYRADKPVKIVTIGIGKDVDAGVLKQIATATGGLSYTTQTPSQITSVFVDAFLHRS